ncbi:DUF4397 domain-containing protein [Pontibacter sp. HSC-14F20]|uniref:DUF4397 domain-containing protein n=1 Tax=Pontibacter sp. HSC-14F20 TaxID=2864136 RepID=UPI001C7351B8|nr:DUF4397 domain-containing protein [Pontibacter sp. HSC-14F20]MBX0332660.1 DUF4397 domain-containing protein [Pontibacter sp. HSC-14F20]
MKNLAIKSLAILATGFFLSACEENAIEEHYEPVTAGAHIKLVHAAQQAPMVNMYLDNSKITALAPTSGGIVTGLSYGGTAVFPASYGYANVSGGSYNLQIIDTTSARGSADVVSNAPVNLNNGATYSAFLIGKAGAFETLLVQDELPVPNNAKAYIRFVNVMVDAPTNFDVKAVRKATVETPETVITVGTNIAYKGNTAYVEIEPGTYDFPIYAAGSETPYTTMTGVAPTGGRVYTLYTRGDYTLTPATSNRVLIRDR